MPTRIIVEFPEGSGCRYEINEGERLKCYDKDVWVVNKHDTPLMRAKPAIKPFSPEDMQIIVDFCAPAFCYYDPGI